MSTQHNHEGHAVSYPVEMVTISCGGCNAIFALSRTFYDAARRNGTDFRCTNPRCEWPSQSYTDTTRKQLEKAREEIERQKRLRQFDRHKIEHLDRSRNAYRGQVTKLKNRARAGLCLFCNRNFKDLKSHMDSKHPEETE